MYQSRRSRLTSARDFEPLNPAWLFAGIAALAGAAWAIWGGGRAQSHKPVITAPPFRPARSSYNPMRVRLGIAVISTRAPRNKHNSMCLDVLSGRYLEECRDTGDIGDPAWATIDKAMSRATIDACMVDHARCIAAEKALTVRARGYFAKAFGINPYYAPFAPDKARAVLTEREPA